MSTFAARQPGLYPTALRGRWGRAWGGAFGAEKDNVVTDAKLAVRSGFIDDAPVDALERHGADVVLDRLSGETDASYRARIAAAWDFWPWAGRRGGVETSLTLLGWTATLYTATEIGATPWAQWWAVAVTVSVVARPWGASDSWGTGVWGSDASRDTVRQSRKFLRSVSNARDIGWLVISTAATAIWGAGTWGTPATWGAAVTRWRI